jgi:hypothetical protein
MRRDEIRRLSGNLFFANQFFPSTAAVRCVENERLLAIASTLLSGNAASAWILRAASSSDKDQFNLVERLETESGGAGGPAETSLNLSPATGGMSREPEHQVPSSSRLRDRGCGRRCREPKKGNESGER